LVKGTSTIEGRIVVEEFPDDLEFRRIRFGNIGGDGTSTCATEASKDDVASTDETFVGVEVEVREEEADGDVVCVERGRHGWRCVDAYASGGHYTVSWLEQRVVCREGSLLGLGAVK
jgi:hypothetical protein